MKHLTRGTRKTDRPGQMVTRGLRTGDVLPSVLGGLGWLGFILALIRCVLHTATP